MNDSRPMPHSLEAEQAVLGAMLNDPNDCGLMITSRLLPSKFYILKHQTIMKESILLVMEGHTLDIVTLDQRLSDKKLIESIGGRDYLIELIRVGWNKSICDHMISIIEDKFKLRQAIESATKLINGCHSCEDGAGAMINESAHQLADIAKNADSGTIRASEIVDVVGKAIDEAYEKHTNVRGASTGFECLDAKTQGLIDGEMIVLGGYRAKGKTSLAANIAAEFCKRGEPVAFFSLEQSKNELLWRMIFSDAEVEPNRYHSPMDKKDVEEAKQRIKTWPLYIDARRGRKAFDICSEAKRLKIRHGIRLVVVDYLQRILWSQDGKNASQNVSVGLNSKALADLAGELECPVLVLSQFNREAAQEQKRPELHSLRGSGEIEEDAYKVLLLSDDVKPGEWFLKGTRYERWSEEQLKPLVICDVAKNKNGACGITFLTFNQPIFKFSDARLLSSLTGKEVDGMR